MALKAELLEQAQEQNLDVTNSNTKAEIQAALDDAAEDSVEPHVTVHLDRDPNDPRDV